MRLREVNLSKDYSMLCSWWSKHGWASIDPSWLPATGLIVENDVGPVCAGFIYRTDSSLFVFEYVVSNPDMDSGIRSLALDQLISSACVVAKAMGAQGLFSAFGDKGLANRMENNGFSVIGSEVTNLLRRL